MSYSVILSGAADQGEGTDGPFHLVSVSGWGAFQKWAQSLPEAGYSSLKGLAARGEWLNTQTLAAELADAVALDELVGRGVAATVARLGEVLGVGASDETIQVIEE